MTDHKKKNGHPAPDPREVRRQNMARYGSTMTPLSVPVNPDELAIALSACASAGLPDPIVTLTTVTPEPPALPYDIDVYTFCHFRFPQVQVRATVTEVANFPNRIIQLAKNAGVRSDSLTATDDPPIAV